MTEDELKHRRRSIRFKDYDYCGAGSYFTTICTRHRQPLFGAIVEGEMVLNEIGIIVSQFWLEIPVHFVNVEMDKFVIMPNHVHGIIIIYPNDDKNMVGARYASPLHSNKTYKTKIHGPKPNSIGAIMASFKSIATKQINILCNTTDQSIWQRNYYEHIIRNEKKLNRIRRYIINNPPRWEYDRENRNGIPINEKKKFWERFLNEFDENG